MVHIPPVYPTIDFYATAQRHLIMYTVHEADSIA